MDAPATRSPIRRAVDETLRRLRWRGSGYRFGTDDDKATIARTLAYLFGFGGFLLLVTLTFPGAPGREEGPLVGIALAAFVVAALLIAGYDRLPINVLKFAPAMGSILVALVAFDAGSGAGGAYAMYLSWVVIAAGCFFDRMLTLIHGVFAVSLYAIALQVTHEAPLLGLDVAMASGAVLVAAIIISGLTQQLRESIALSAEAAHTDALTGLPNRRELDAALDREIDRARRTGRPFALIVADLDSFKAYNDANGHPEGDAALRAVSQIFSEGVRRIDTAARFGGEEFAILVAESDALAAKALAERLRAGVEHSFARQEPALTASFGVASFDEHGNDCGQLMQAADQALYEAKNNGRNRCAVARAVPRGIKPLEVDEALSAAPT